VVHVLRFGAPVTPSVQQAVERLREHMKYPASHPWTHGSRNDLRTVLDALADAEWTLGERYGDNVY